MAETHLPEQPWTTEAKVQLHTRECLVYADEWHPEGEKARITSRPFAMIWTHMGDEQRGPITVTSEEAVLQFASKFDNMNPNPGRVVGAVLKGKVRITGPDGLDVTGTNFIFSEQALKIWTDSPIEFAYGPHNGRAKGLDVELIPSTLPPGRDRPAVRGIRNIHLRKNVEMDLVLDEHRRPMPVRITSADSFDFQVEKHVAAFEGLVRAARQTAPGLFDWIECHRLTLFFAPKGQAGKADAPPGAPLEEDEFQRLDFNLEFQRLYAVEGDRQRIIVGSHANDLRGDMSDLLYDARQRRIVTVSRSGPVTIVQKQSQLKCPEINLLLGEDGTITTAICRGAGSLEGRNATTGEIEFAADWFKQLRKFPDPETGLDIIELQENATFRQPNRRTALGAELIRVWVTPLQAGSSRGKEQRTDANMADVRPRRLMAWTEVALVSPQLQAECQKLDVVFHDRGPDLPLLDSSVGQRSRRTLQPAIKQVVHQTPISEAGEPATQSNGGLAAPRKGSEPLNVAADQITVRMLQGDKSEPPEVAEVWTDGNVTLTQQQRQGREPLSLTGERIHLQNSGENRQVVHLFGKPAHIRNGGMHLQGKQIHLKRGENLAWVDGDGLLQFPVTQSLEGQPLDQPQMLDIWWNERMVFNGQVADFDRDARAVLGDSSMLCQQMRVTLSQRLSFTEENQDTSAVDVERIECLDGVEFQSNEYQTGTLTQIRRGKVWTFSLDQTTGKTEAKGPGQMALWRRGTGQGAALSPAQQAQANQPARTERSEWEYTRIKFNGDMLGNMHQRHTTFHDGVQVVYGPVARPMETVDPDDPDNLPRDAGQMRCNSLEVTQVPERGSQPAYVQLLGNGNAYLDGRGFYARADQISYDQSKGLYVLRSLGNGKASIWREKTRGGGYQPFEAQRMDFIPSENYLKFDRATGGEGLNR